MNLVTQNIQSILSEDNLNNKTESYIEKIAKNPYNAWSYSNLGDILLENNQLQKASFLYQKALNINPSFHGFYYKLGIVYQKLKDYPQSHFYYATAIALNSENYWYYDSLCQSLIEINQIPQAIAYYEQALKLGQKPAKIYRQLGMLYRKQGNTKKAIEIYQKLLAIEANKFDYLYIAESYLEENILDRAIFYYQEALKLKKDFQEAHQGLGDAFSRQIDIDRAIFHYQKAKYHRKRNLNSDFSSLMEYNYIVNHQYHFVYCPIYKVACSSLKRLMLQIREPQNFSKIIKKFTKGQLHNYVDNAYSLFRHKDREINAILQGDKYFKFVFVRNPWNRLVSAYLNKFVFSSIEPCAVGVIESIYKDKGFLCDREKSITFRQFLSYLANTEDKLLDGHWKPQYLFLGNIKFDFIGKLENIVQDFQYIKQKISLNIDLDWVNKTNNNDNLFGDKFYADCYPNDFKKAGKIPSYKSFYTTELVELVRNRYQTDIQKFDYKFE